MDTKDFSHLNAKAEDPPESALQQLEAITDAASALALMRKETPDQPIDHAASLKSLMDVLKTHRDELLMRIESAKNARKLIQNHERGDSKIPENVLKDAMESARDVAFVRQVTPVYTAAGNALLAYADLLK